jgi:CheY-like chemotaxis protein
MMGKRILVADDSRTIQQAFTMVMDGAGYELSFAKSVDEALAMAKRDGRPDLVLSDVALGNGNGYDLCAGIKADAALREVPVYILASSHNPYDDARGRRVGADGHLAKPFESQALLDAVASVLAAPPKLAKPVSAVMPQFSADADDNTARISPKDLPVEDDDSYGEITIERAVPPMAASTQSMWGKPPTRTSASDVRPVPAVGTVQAPSASPSPRPSLIPGARPSANMPVARTGMTPVPAASTPAPGSSRNPLNRTVMGFPSVKPPVVNRPTGPGMPAAPAAPTSTRSASLAAPSAPAAAAPSRPVVISTPPAPAAPAANKPQIPPPASANQAMASSLRPPVPRLSSPPPTAPVSPAAPVTRKVATPVPPAAIPPSSGQVSSHGLAAVVSAAVDQKVASLAARGPEYEAIAKLSREIIEQVVWEVVPELAETIIRQEIDRLASVKK